MRCALPDICVILVLTAAAQAFTQDRVLIVPRTLVAGNGFEIASTGSGQATVYIVGPGQVLKRAVQLGEAIRFPYGSLYNAGRYAVILEQGSSARDYPLDVIPAGTPTSLSFLARPSRLPVGMQRGITGAAYVFDAYGNLIVAPMSMSFELSSPAGDTQKEVVETQNGVGWLQMNSTSRQGIDRFAVYAGGVSSVRIIRQVPGDPCELKMSVQPVGRLLHLVTAPVRDCSGNAVSDGTIVTFTATYSGGQSTVDVPLKRGIAEINMPPHKLETISVASGVILGNQVKWEK